LQQKYQKMNKNNNLDHYSKKTIKKHFKDNKKHITTNRIPRHGVKADAKNSTRFFRNHHRTKEKDTKLHKIKQ